ncbi:MAG: hypothetical protein ACO2Y9_11415 [Pseudohongiellaceae bacterium]|jgi:hypothetical protein
MIGIWSAHAQTFMLVFAILAIVVFVIPMIFAPIFWARMLLWNIPEDTDLVVYSLRSLGSLGLVVLLITFRAATTGEGLLFVYELFIPFFALMVLVHLYGAIKKIQPITETLEIGFWLALLVLALCFMPAA